MQRTQKIWPERLNAGSGQNEWGSIPGPGAFSHETEQHPNDVATLAGEVAVGSTANTGPQAPEAETHATISIPVRVEDGPNSGVVQPR